MKRRKFLLFSSAFTLFSLLKAKSAEPFEVRFKEVEPILNAVQEHLFPEGSKIPSAKEMNAKQFLAETMMHPTFDKEIQAFVLEGAKRLEKRTKGTFASMSETEKEKALRGYEQTKYGRHWLFRILSLSLEAIFSDPIYGSNINEAGWKSLSSFGGFPRPLTRYAEAL
ncbi:MAG: hypothetical protein RL113_76 [Pseudomonadota bacterium]